MRTVTIGSNEQYEDRILSASNLSASSLSAAAAACGPPLGASKILKNVSTVAPDEQIQRPPQVISAEGVPRGQK